MELLVDRSGYFPYWIHGAHVLWLRREDDEGPHDRHQLLFGVPGVTRQSSLAVGAGFEAVTDLVLDPYRREVVRSLAAAIEAKDANTVGHLQRVSNLALRLGEELALSEVELGRADQVADVLDEHQGAALGSEVVEGVADLVGVEVARPAGLDLVDGGSGRRDPPGVEVGLLVPLDHRALPAPGQEGRERSFEEGRLPRPGGADQVEGADPHPGEVAAHVGGVPVVLGEERLLDPHDPG